MGGGGGGRNVGITDVEKAPCLLLGYTMTSVYLSVSMHDVCVCVL